jgi:zinc transport system substrate-binding protein
MKTSTALITIIFSATILSGCQSTPSFDIVTTMFPQYDFVRSIVKDQMTVTLLLPPGAEVHDFEATSKDLIQIKQSKLFIYTSLEIDPWVGDDSLIGGEQTVVMDLSQSAQLSYSINPPLNLQTKNAITTTEEIHYWTDPIVAIQLIEKILEKIVLIDPVNSAFYTENANEYIDSITTTFTDFGSYLTTNNYQNSTIFFAGHNALSSFGTRHNLLINSLFENFIPDEDLTSAQLVGFVNEIKLFQVKYLFIEEVHYPKAALTIQTELAKDDYVLTLLELHGYHNLTNSDFLLGSTYLSIYQRNISNIKTSLEAL